MSGQVTIPIIDVSALVSAESTLEQRQCVADLIGKACEDIGFFIIVGHQIDQKLIDNIWSATKTFFDLPLEEKMNLSKPQHEYPFGYSKLGGEILSAGKAVEKKGTNNVEEKSLPDLKEMFAIGPNGDGSPSSFPVRLFPSAVKNFDEIWTEYYASLAVLASKILRGFALSLGLEENFFQQFIDRHGSALRAINYPSIKLDDRIQPGQLRASAHTDYGTMTILRSDGPGLQVSKDKSPPTWCDVPHVEGGFVINLGDLMRRWTNDKWLSTLHRVVITSGEISNNGNDQEITKRRQSLAFFHNLNKDALVEVLLNSDEVPKHEPIIAGDFLMQKHLASVSSN